MQRNICQAGQIVRANAGRDAGRFFVVTAIEGTWLFIADGKTRKLASPKRKNPLHVQATGSKLALEGLTDKALRAALRELNGSQSNPNQIRKEVIDDVETGCN